MKGKITKKNAWKNGLGYFVGIEDVDYMFYGKTDANVGDTVIYEPGKPAKDGKPTLETIIPCDTADNLLKKSPGGAVRNERTEQEIREWNMRRGGMSHDAATVVAGAIVKGGLEFEHAAQAIVDITDYLMDAANEAEAKYRKGGRR